MNPGYTNDEDNDERSALDWVLIVVLAVFFMIAASIESDDEPLQLTKPEVVKDEKQKNDDS